MYTTEKKFQILINKIKELSTHKTSLIIAIDGRCASGKTTLAACLKEQLDCNVIHMDQFFLQPHMRTPQRLAQPGGNVDYERFLTEVLIPLTKGKPFSYRPYNCKKQQLDEEIEVSPTAITIIEGSYSCHPFLHEYYDLRVFLTTHYEEQLRRIRERNGEASLEVFKEKWIPLEELYFNNLEIDKQCDICITT